MHRDLEGVVLYVSPEGDVIVSRLADPVIVSHVVLAILGINVRDLDLVHQRIEVELLALFDE